MEFKNWKVFFENANRIAYFYQWSETCSVYKPTLNNPTYMKYSNIHEDQKKVLSKSIHEKDRARLRAMAERCKLF